MIGGCGTVISNNSHASRFDHGRKDMFELPACTHYGTEPSVMMSILCLPRIVS